MAVIEVEGLRKEYRRRRRKVVALDGLDLSVPEGGVFGFLGPNGSGKTTTIRCLLGLARPTAGACRVLGANSPHDLPRVISTVGSLVETPGLFPNMSGRRNLALLGRIDGLGRSAVHDVLDRVGLAGRADDPVRGYSMGMRQRLGIAVALLKDPQLLVLDEPANGLDPAGIKEVRELLRSLGAEGRTVFVSSHLLSEVQQTCNRVAILARGRCLRSGLVSEVLSSGRVSGIVVRLPDLEKGANVLQEAGIGAVVDGSVLRVDLPASEAATVTRVLAARELYLSELRPEEVSLETVFLALTGEGVDESVP
ncbi:MAG TPA: ATP-binding cassette domain-containing protein [Acidimicrobiales bacterium]|nr:ATP-binding cassette domain-containing protein [Acidimicrobiales bacterium]